MNENLFLLMELMVWAEFPKFYQIRQIDGYQGETFNEEEDICSNTLVNNNDNSSSLKFTQNHIVALTTECKNLQLKAV